jgi:hypothetical protein
MYDYKFRQSEVSFAKRQSLMRRKLLGAIALLIAAGIAYAVLKIDFNGTSTTPNSESGSEVIPLSLPSKPVSGQNSCPGRDGIVPSVAVAV